MWLNTLKGKYILDVLKTKALPLDVLQSLLHSKFNNFEEGSITEFQEVCKKCFTPWILNPCHFCLLPVPRKSSLISFLRQRAKLKRASAKDKNTLDLYENQKNGLSYVCRSCCHKGLIKLKLPKEKTEKCKLKKENNIKEKDDLLYIVSNRKRKKVKETKAGLLIPEELKPQKQEKPQNETKIARINVEDNRNRTHRVRFNCPQKRMKLNNLEVIPNKKKLMFARSKKLKHILGSNTSNSNKKNNSLNSVLELLF